jgi:hypothetical protein
LASWKGPACFTNTRGAAGKVTGGSGWQRSAGDLEIPAPQVDPQADLDEAFIHLDRALDLHDPGLGYLAVAPQWDSLRDDPRFAERLKRMALRPV